MGNFLCSEALRRQPSTLELVMTTVTGMKRIIEGYNTLSNLEVDALSRPIKANVENLFKNHGFEKDVEDLSSQDPTLNQLLNVIFCAWNDKYTRFTLLRKRTNPDARTLTEIEFIESFAQSFDPIKTIANPIKQIPQDHTFDRALLIVLWMSAGKCSKRQKFAPFASLMSAKTRYWTTDIHKSSIFRRAREVLMQIFTDDNASRNFLEAYHHLNIKGSRLERLENGNASPFSPEDQKHVCEELTSFLPSQLYVFPKESPFIAVTLFQGAIGIRKDLLFNPVNKASKEVRSLVRGTQQMNVDRQDEESKEPPIDREKENEEDFQGNLGDPFYEAYETILAAKTVLVILHELAHCKRYLTQAERNLFSLTPDYFENEAGEYFEKKVFGEILKHVIAGMTLEIARQVLDVKTWGNDDLMKRIGSELKRETKVLEEAAEEEIKPEATKGWITPFDNEDAYCIKQLGHGK